MLSPAFVYILTNKRHTVLYVGMTVNLKRRLLQHREKAYKNSFTACYNISKLVYFEEFLGEQKARIRERYLKGKTRKFKIDLINSKNPFWLDLSLDILN
jgi:putative endonuclease